MSKQRNYPDSSWAFIPATETRASHHYCLQVRATLGGFPPRHLVFLVRWCKRKPASTVIWRPIHHVSHFSAPSLLHMCPPPGSLPSQNSFFSKHWEDLGFALQFPPSTFAAHDYEENLYFWLGLCCWVWAFSGCDKRWLLSLRFVGFSLWWLFLSWTTGFSNGLSCCAACGIFLDQRCNLSVFLWTGGGRGVFITSGPPGESLWRKS